MSKPSLPQGTRDFGPEIVRKRNYILQTIRSVFEVYGFQPLETPAMENLETLMGKYGEEGDKLIFKILNNGLDNPEKKQKILEDFEKVLRGKNVKSITERALKYDLTIPFARYVAMHHSQLTFPYKRYQMQPVWRADRPQKGRYREFYQCDADVVGSSSLLNETELICIYQEVFSKLGMSGFDLRINHRKILVALAEACGGPDLLTAITTAIDKLDKVGLEKVRDELAQRGMNNKAIGLITQYLAIDGTTEEKLGKVRELLPASDSGKQGADELQWICTKAKSVNPGGELTIDFTLARGLNYYTGTILEAKAPSSVSIGSIGGGGRYDDLTGLFDVPGIPGVGISFGVDRIYDVLEELKLFPESVGTGTKILFFNTGTDEAAAAFKLMQEIRHKGISAELYHEAAKFDKQFKYAEKKQIPFVVIIGQQELQDNTCKLKTLSSGQQQTMLQTDLIHFNF